MPRPKFSPTDEQRRTIDALTKLARARAKLDADTDALVTRARTQDIPVSVIAEAVGMQRKTVYRHLGRDM